MKGKHQLTLTDAQGNVWLNVGVEKVELGDGCIQANFTEVTGEPAKRVQRRKRVPRKARVSLSAKQVSNCLKDIRKFARPGAVSGEYSAARLRAVAKEWKISYTQALQIHQLKHRHLRK